MLFKRNNHARIQKVLILPPNNLVTSSCSKQKTKGQNFPNFLADYPPSRRLSGCGAKELDSYNKPSHLTEIIDIRCSYNKRNYQLLHTYNCSSKILILISNNWHRPKTDICTLHSTQLSSQCFISH